MIKVDTHFLRRCLFGCNSGLWDESTGRRFLYRAQNGALPIMAGALLHKGTTVLYNVPDIEDTRCMTDILREIGAAARKRVPVW